MEEKALSGRRILIAEDDAFLSSILSVRLMHESAVVGQAVTGAEVLDKAKDFEPEIILLDILLPGMDGIEVLRHLKEDETTRQIPVIMFSNLNDNDKVEASMQLGAVGYYVKSSTPPEDIIVKIAEALAQSAQA